MQFRLARLHRTLAKATNSKPTAPAMAVELTKRVWTFGDQVELIETQEADAREGATRRFHQETGYHGKRPSK